jgi:hypothetical protein
LEETCNNHKTIQILKANPKTWDLNPNKASLKVTHNNHKVLNQFPAINRPLRIPWALWAG